MRLGNRVAWWVLVLGTVAGCRLGFEELDSFVVTTPSAGGDTVVTGFGAGAGNAAPAGGAVNGGGALGDGGTLNEAGSTNEAGSANGDSADQGGAAPNVAGSGGSAAGNGSAGAAGSGGLAATAGNPSAGAGGASNGGASAGGSGGAAGASGGPVGSGGTSGTSGAASGGAAGAPPSLPNCQTKYFNARPYLLCSPEVSWDSAKSSCASVGMVLARVDNSAENQWLFANAYDVGTASKGMWIGANESLLEGTWQWADGTLFWIGGLFGSAQSGLYTNWANSQPGSLLNDCGAINLGASTSGTWYSDLCLLGTNVYACESTL